MAACIVKVSHNQTKGQNRNSFSKARSQSTTQTTCSNNLTHVQHPPRYRRKKSHDERKVLNSESHYVQASVIEATDSENLFVSDTAASHHFVKEKSLFDLFTLVSNEKIAVAVDGVSFPIKGKSIVKLRFGPRIIELKDVLYVPNLRHNLISGSKVDFYGAQFAGQKGIITINNFKGERIFTTKLKNGIYVINPKPVTNPRKSISFEDSLTSANDAMLWHCRFKHVYHPLLSRTSQLGCVCGLPKLKFDKFFCEICKLNKHKHRLFKKLQEIHCTHPLELLHVDT